MLRFFIKKKISLTGTLKHSDSEIGFLKSKKKGKNEKEFVGLFMLQIKFVLLYQ